MSVSPEVISFAAWVLGAMLIAGMLVLVGRLATLVQSLRTATGEAQEVVEHGRAMARTAEALCSSAVATVQEVRSHCELRCGATEQRIVGLEGRMDRLERT